MIRVDNISHDDSKLEDKARELVRCNWNREGMGGRVEKIPRVGRGLKHHFQLIGLVPEISFSMPS
jgi:hypothetical protein